MLRLRRAGTARVSPAAKPLLVVPRWARSAPEFATRPGSVNTGLGASHVCKHVFNITVLKEKGKANAMGTPGDQGERHPVLCSL